MRTVLFLIQKETLHVLRDRIMLIQILVPPVLQLMVLAHAMTFEVRRVDLALVDLDGSPASQRLTEQFLSTGRFRVAVRTASGDRADAALLAREANVVLRIASDFSRRLDRGQAPRVQLILNAEDGAAAGVVQAQAVQILAGFARAEAAARRAGGGPALSVQTRTLYNPQRAYLGFMAIGMLSTLMTLVGVLLAAQNIAREKEVGTLEQLNVTPITRAQFIAGKLIPFLGFGLVELTLGLGIIRWVHGVPFAGAVGWVYAGAFVYLLAALGLGLLISTAVQTQQQAQFITFFVVVTFIFLGGIFTPVASMPGWAQQLAALNPIKHFVFLMRTVLMKGGGWAEIRAPLGAMAIFAALALGIAVARYRKTTA